MKNPSKFIAALAAVALTAVLLPWTAPAFAGKQCAFWERDPLPNCITIKYRNKDNNGWTTHRPKNNKPHAYQISSSCPEEIKYHEDIANRRDAGYKIKPGQIMQFGLGWNDAVVYRAYYRAFQCCTIHHAGYRCDFEDELRE